MKYLLLLLAACSSPEKPSVDDAGMPPDGPVAVPRAVQSSSIATDGTTVYVVNPDADSISIVDVATRNAHEVLLAGAHPTVDANGDYAPAVMPRAIALQGDTVYVTGERSGMLYALAPSGMKAVPACNQPIGVVATATELYVACAADAEVIALDRASLAITAHIATAAKPWGLAAAGDGTIIATHLLGPGVTTISDHVATLRAIPDVAPRGDKRLAHGQVRGIYAVAPAGDQLWISHLMLGTDTPQPDLDVESTAFPAVTRMSLAGTLRDTLTIDAEDVPGVDGAFHDVVSGPHAIALTATHAYVVDANSEDLMELDIATGVETRLLRPLSGQGPEGLAIAGGTAYLDQRFSSDIAVVDLATLTITATIPRLDADPMPADLRLGQRVFFSANSDEFPVTQNHWIACATCHLEGESDAVTWKFAQGPRDTPSNAGGTRDTGFLFRTAQRNAVQQYWHTVQLEQGGAMDGSSPLLDPLAHFVDHALPLPPHPETDAALVATGAQVFASAGCATCHTGPRFTDSGAGNATLDLAGTVLLHDVGTCAAGDVAQPDVDGHPRAACMFDTPSLSGIASTPPYLHDGSAPTLREAIVHGSSTLTAAQLDALVEYLRSL